MAYEQRVIPEQGGYKGVLLSNGEVVAVTNIYSTLLQAGNALRDLIRQKLPVQKGMNAGSTQPNFLPKPPSHPIIVGQKRCCGRG